jgi:uncharacterized membrane protein YgdD (TMEM256/DUF423 family)
VNKTFLTLAALLGGLAVIAGALLAHTLKPRMPEDAWGIFDTAVKYQFYHVFALMAAGILTEKFDLVWIRRAGRLFFAGILLFSGSLYIISVFLTLRDPVPVLLGICTPLGGLALIGGWVSLFVGIWKRGNS